MRDLLWRGVDTWRAEAATIELAADGLIATGTQLGAEPQPYRLDYRLDASAGHVTRSIVVVARGDGWRRELELRRDSDGVWSGTGGAAALAGALDCDLGFSPLTNTLPIRRSGLHRHAGAEDFVMAWISVPDLAVSASAQRYEHVRPGVVRYVDRGTFDGFTAALEVDEDGLVLRYPGLAERQHVSRRQDGGASVGSEA
jgi:hypothetical protein